jgi:hypothetical protein
VQIHKNETLNRQNKNNMAAVGKQQYKQSTETQTLNPEKT